jgi:cell division protein FtsB
MRNGKKISIMLVGSVLLAAAFMVGFGREYLRNRSIEREIAGLQSENSRLEGKKLEFLSLIDDLSSEYYLEEQSRTKQGMAKPGETLILVDTGEYDAKPAGAVKGASDELSGLSNPSKWLYYFFDHEHFLGLKEL